jgi:type VI secretion system protein ImpB
VPNRVNPGAESDINVELPIESMKSFHPDEIAKHVPKLRALQMLRSLLMEMQSSIDNRKDLRRVLYELFSNPQELEKVLSELKAYESLRLPSGAAADTATGPAKPDSSAKPS